MPLVTSIKPGIPIPIPIIFDFGKPDLVDLEFLDLADLEFHDFADLD